MAEPDKVDQSVASPINRVHVGMVPARVPLLRFATVQVDPVSYAHHEPVGRVRQSAVARPRAELQMPPAAGASIINKPRNPPVVLEVSLSENCIW